MNTSLSILMRRYAAERGIALSTLGRLATGSSTLFVRMGKGRVTIATIDRATQWLSDHWPADLDWPADIPRPAPRTEEDAA